MTSEAMQWGDAHSTSSWPCDGDTGGSALGARAAARARGGVFSEAGALAVGCQGLDVLVYSSSNDQHNDTCTCTICDDDALSAVAAAAADDDDGGSEEMRSAAPNSLSAPALSPAAHFSKAATTSDSSYCRA